MYLAFDIAILCEKTVYYMGVRVMRWDNITVVYGSTFLWALVGSIESPQALRALGLQIEPTCAHRKVLRTLP